MPFQSSKIHDNIFNIEPFNLFFNSHKNESLSVDPRIPSRKILPDAGRHDFNVRLSHPRYPIIHYRMYLINWDRVALSAATLPYKAFICLTSSQSVLYQD